MAKVLVTGAAGFIASHLLQELIIQGHEVLGIDNLDPYYSPEVKRGNLEKIQGTFNFRESDIRELGTLKKIVSDFGPDYVIHEAAQAGVRASVDDPVKTAQVNVEGTLNLLECLRQNQVKKLVFASSSSVYGKVVELPFTEDHPKNPISPYGVTKLACEKMVECYQGLYGIESVMLRYFTVYGERIRPDLAIHKFTKTALEGGALEVYGDGTKSRDFTHVSDVVEATIKAMDRGQGAYNIGGGSVLTVKELAEKIIDHVGSGTIEYVEDVAADVKHTQSDTSKAKRELEWKPAKDFDKGLAETVEWVRRIYS